MLSLILARQAGFLWCALSCPLGAPALASVPVLQESKHCMADASTMLLDNIRSCPYLYVQSQKDHLFPHSWHLVLVLKPIANGKICTHRV